MKKRITALLICASVFSQMAVFAETAPSWEFEQTTIDGTLTDGENTNKQPTRETFNLDVGMMTQKQIDNLNQTFTKLDLTKYVNRDIKDDVEGDHQGGWSDQGENDLRMFNTFGSQEMLGVPFNFIDPAQNDNKAVLGLRGQHDTGIPNKVEIPIGKTAAGAYFIQASPWCSGTCGTYTWVYEDGSESSMDILQNEHICDFWGKASYDFVRPAWTATKADGSLRSLYLFAMNNPHPEKRIKSLRLQTEGGGAYIMIMAITLTDKGPYLTTTKSAESITMSTFGWYEYAQRDENKVSGTAIDFSGYLDAPAGKHGALKADGEDLVFTDGTKARFWGADISGEAAFPTKEEADKASSRIAHSGINLVRFTDFDEAILKEGTTNELDADKMDKMAYFIAQLKEKGVYSYVSFLSKRTLKEDSAIENYADFSEGYGIDAFFDEGLIDLQKKFVTSFLGYKNEYTGMSFGEDPAIVMAELVEDLSLYDHNSGKSRMAFANDTQYEKARVRFNAFLARKYSSDKTWSDAWNGVNDRHDYESVEKKTVELRTIKYNALISDSYKKDVSEFFAEVLEDYYAKMKEAFTSYEKLVTINSNGVNQKRLQDTMANAKTDFVTRTFYNAKPLGKNEKITERSVLYKFGYGSMTKNKENMVKDFAENAPAGKPYIANWGAAMPNLYFSEGSLMMAALAGQKNWSAIQHSFANEEYSDKTYIDDFYSIYNNPVRLALAPVAASIFYSSQAEDTKVLNLNEDDVNKEREDINSLNDERAFETNTRFDFSSRVSDKITGASPNVLKTNFVFWDSAAGIFEARTSKAEAVSGFLSAPEELPTFIISADNNFVTAALISLDDKNVGQAEHYLLTAVCGNQNYKSRINLEKNIYDILGEEKIMVEAITGNVTLKRTGDFLVYPLTSSGERMEPVGTTKDRSGYTSFKLLADSKAVQYEIVKK